ncbi:alkyl hydroperoxide reductase [Pseudomonas aeruginosa]|nr:alkyl hydroperoxide reductase [Pseudomonas aeruginosa]
MSVDQGHQSFLSQLNGVFQIDWENLNGVRQKCPIDLGHQLNYLNLSKNI